MYEQALFLNIRGLLTFCQDTWEMDEFRGHDERDCEEGERLIR